MYYSSGNYEAFARPQKPKDVEHKSAYIIGTGLAALTAAIWCATGRCRAAISTSLRRIRFRAAPATDTNSRGLVMSCAAAARWTTTLR